MARYIDADKFLKDQIRRCGCVPLIGTCTMDNESLKDIVEQTPTADVMEVKHGKWIKRGNEKKCSVCGFIYYSNNDDWNGCPNCLSKMDGKDTNVPTK